MNLIAMLMLAADLNGQPLPDVVLLDFTAGYCQPCQQMVPVLQRMEQDNFPVRRIDITENPDTSRQYKVDRIPTLVLLVEGREAQRRRGIDGEGGEVAGDEVAQEQAEAAAGGTVRAGWPAHDGADYVVEDAGNCHGFILGSPIMIDETIVPTAREDGQLGKSPPFGRVTGVTCSRLWCLLRYLNAHPFQKATAQFSLVFDGGLIWPM